MFNIFKSNRMENLMSAFAAQLQTPLPDPMAPEWIGVQSRGMKQWISARLADESGICANTRFLFPKQIIENILKTVLPGNLHEPDPDSSALFWVILKQVMAMSGAQGLDRVAQYVRDDASGRKKFQLSKRIAACFDNYLIYRPELILNWRGNEGKTILNDPDAAWQALMWQELSGRLPGVNFADKADRFLKMPAKELDLNTSGIPTRISFFGIFSMPPLFLNIFEKLSRVIEVNLFILSPSDQYFFDAKPEASVLRGELQKKRDSQTDSPDTDYFNEEINPLVSSFAGSGQEFFWNLESLNYQEPYPDLYHDPAFENETMLTRLQSDIFGLVKRKSPADRISIRHADRSVSIHSCHSPMRETQVLKDLLLEAFETCGSLFPHDVIVMMPDIEAYAPFIEAVFPNEHPLPFSISDRRKRSESRYIEAFLAVLSLQNERIDISQLLELLSYLNIRKRFRLETTHLSEIEKMVQDAGVLWAMDEKHRQRLGLPAFKENTWQFGLERLFMGMALPEDTLDPVFDVFPSSSLEGQDLEILGKLARFCHTLFGCIRHLDDDQTICSWVDILLWVHERMMVETPGSAEDAVFIYQTLETIRQGAGTAGVDEKISFDMMAAILREELDKSVSQGSFLAGRITFCNIMPMRSIPYKVVVLMGMDEAAFPRKVFSAGFDLMGKYPKSGDKNERRDDRYLFLETLLSAREQLIITYTGQDIRDNSRLPCSGAISELMDVIEDSFSFEPGYEFHHFHKLHPFDSAYFDARAPFFSFSRDNLKIAASALKTEQVQERSFIQSVKNSSSPETQDGIRLSLANGAGQLPEAVLADDLGRFFKNPARWLMHSRLKMTLSDIEKESQDRESYNLDGLSRYKMGQWVLEHEIEDENRSDFYPVFKAMGSLPFDHKGKVEYEKLASAVRPLSQKAREMLTSRKLPAVTAEVKTDPLLVQLHVRDIHENGMNRITFGSLNGSRMLDSWIRHLVMNASKTQGYPEMTRMLGRDPEKKKDALVVEFEPLDSRAQDFLQTLVRIYCRGQEEPVPFFVRTAFVFARRMQNMNFSREPSDIQKAIASARPFWTGDFNRSGECEDRYVQWCFNGSDPLASGKIFKPGGFVETALAVFEPMLQHMRVLP